MSPLYTLDAKQRAALLDQIRAESAHDPELLFAYVYGSFVESEVVHDIDIGVYVRSDKLENATTIALDLAQRLTARLRLPVDIRVLNRAPVSFLYHVLRGRLIISRDEKLLTEIIEDTVRRYLDIAPILRHSAKEAFAA